MDRPKSDTRPTRRISLMRRFFDSEASGGMILMGVTVIALVVANSPLAGAYFGLLKTYILGLSVLHWINDALMAVFFLLVGLEIKREMLDGHAVVMCHYAFRTWKNMGRGWIDLHGHSHGKLKPQTRQYDVGVDAFDYRPVTLETILGTRHRRAAAKTA